jgi:hypothetical protein
VHTTNPGESGCPYTVTVRGNLCNPIPFDTCLQNDGPGNQDYLRMVVNVPVTDPNHGYYQYHVGATGETFCGICEFVSYVPGHSLTAYDRDDPYLVLNVNINYGAKTGTATFQNRCTGKHYRIQDRNILNDTCMGGALTCTNPCPTPAR